ncbi:MAG: class I adenylate-forming enzyme family protein [Georgfuchsia sp.]
MSTCTKNCNIVEVILAQAAQCPAAPALILRNQVLSFRELTLAINHLASVLLDAGVQQGQVVGISMGQTPQHLMTQLALAQIGAVSLPVHAMISAQRRQLAATRFDAAWIVSGREEMRLDGLPFINLDPTRKLMPNETLTPVAQVDANTPFRIALSSGTSGDPKGVMFSHGYMLDRMTKTNYACNPLSRIVVMDLNFAIGFVFAIGMLAAGGAVIFPASSSAMDLAMAVNAHAATHWLLSPAQAKEIARLLMEDGIHFPTLEHLRIVGSTPDAKLMRTLKARFSANVFVPYGSTEMGPISIATPEILSDHPDCAGRLFPWAKAEIVNEKDQPLLYGQVGRLRLRAEGMVTGYHHDEARSAEQFRDGWYYPGDQAHLSNDGLLFIDGREDDVLNVNGNKFRPADVESVLQEHPAVVDAAALVLEEAPGRQFLTAAVIVSSPLEMAELIRFASERLGPMTPRHIIAMQRFPRNTTGKLLRRQLAGEVGQAMAASSGRLLH